MNSVKAFYDANPFPGEYTREQLMNIGFPPGNRYLGVIDRYLEDGQKVLDVGCGTGLITNLFATRYVSKFIGLDFSLGVDIANQFAKTNHIDNVEFVKEDFYSFDPLEKFDIVIAQSFLTHAADPVSALQKLMTAVRPGGTIIFSVYNTAGQLLKNVCNLNYKDQRLELDQKHNPLDNVYDHKSILSKFSDWKLQEVMPSINNRFVRLSAFFNSRNGGLTMYVFKNE